MVVRVRGWTCTCTWYVLLFCCSGIAAACGPVKRTKQRGVSPARSKRLTNHSRDCGIPVPGTASKKRHSSNPKKLPYILFFLKKSFPRILFIREKHALHNPPTPHPPKPPTPFHENTLFFSTAIHDIVFHSIPHSIHDETVGDDDTHAAATTTTIIHLSVSHAGGMGTTFGLHSVISTQSCHISTRTRTGTIPSSRTGNFGTRSGDGMGIIPLD